MVRPYSTAAERAVCPADCAQLRVPPRGMHRALCGRTFLGVLVNPPWDRKGCTVATIEALALDHICPLGFVFIWVEKEVLHQVVDVLSKAKFVYVENLTWVMLQPSNRVVTAPAPIIARSHRTLLIFRRDTREFPKAKDTELRHQRSPDVDVAVVSTGTDGRLLTPAAAYEAIETLLPGGYTAGQPGRFAELWGHTEIQRAGWTHCVE